MLNIGNYAKTLAEKYRNCFGLPFRNHLSEWDIQSVVRTSNIFWRERVFSPSVTIWAMLSQVLDSDRACRLVSARVAAYLVSEGKPACSDDPSAYCQARKRLPADALPSLSRLIGNRIEEETSEIQLWFGRRVRIVDGSSVSMPDTSENQREFPQPSEQSPGCGFPVASFAAIFSWSTGIVLDASMGSLHVHERTLFHRIWDCLKPDDILMSDRGFCSYADIAVLKKRGIDIVMRSRKKRSDFRRGKCLGKGDHLVIWQKPKQRPNWLSEEEFSAIPDKMELREVQMGIDIPGFRTRKVTAVTTLLDPITYPKSMLMDLYRQRWFCEIDLRHLKTSLKMDVLRSHTPEIIRKEFWAHILVYNLIRGVMNTAAKKAGLSIRSLSFKGAIQRLTAIIPHLNHSLAYIRENLLMHLIKRIVADILPDRPNRVEPRARKRRPKSYKLLTLPRHEARRRLVG